MNSQPAVSRPLPLQGAYNVRDLGGYPAKDGKLTKRKAFLRADSLADLTADDRIFLYDYGVRLVIDLRSEMGNEAQSRRHRFPKYGIFQLPFAG